MNIVGKVNTDINILLVEDGPGDIRLTREAFRETNGSIKLHVVVDGVEALAFLKKEGAHAYAASSGYYPAGSQPSQNGRPRASGSHQG